MLIHSWIADAVLLPRSLCFFYMHRSTRPAVCRRPARRLVRNATVAHGSSRSRGRCWST